LPLQILRFVTQTKNKQESEHNYMKQLLEAMLLYITSSIGTIQPTSVEGGFMIKHLKDNVDADALNAYLKEKGITHLYAKDAVYKYEGVKEDVIYLNRGKTITADSLMPE